MERGALSCSKSLLTKTRDFARGYTLAEVKRLVRKRINWSWLYPTFPLADKQQREAWMLRARDEGWTVHELPPNTQGIAALMMLDLMEQFPLGEFGFHSAEALHVMIEAKKLAYADMLRYVGDPRFAKTPLPAMLNIRAPIVWPLPAKRPAPSATAISRPPMDGRSSPPASRHLIADIRTSPRCGRVTRLIPEPSNSATRCI